MFAIAFLLCAAGIINVEAISFAAAASTQVLENTQKKAFRDSEDYEIQGIKGVTSLLRQIHKKKSTQLETDTELYHKNMCACETEQAELEKAIEKAKAEIPSTESELDQTGAKESQLENTIVEETAQEAEDKKAIAEATAIHEKEKKALDACQVDTKKSLKAVNSAIDAIVSNVATASFLQSPTAAKLQQLTVSLDMNPNDRDLLTSFLANDTQPEFLQVRQDISTPVRRPDGGCATTLCGCHGCCPESTESAVVRKEDPQGTNCAGYDECEGVCDMSVESVCPDGKGRRKIGPLCCACPIDESKLSGGSQQIIGILKQMQEDLEKDLKECIGEEAAKVWANKNLIGTKQRELVQTEEIIDKTTQEKNEEAVHFVETKNDLKGTETQKSDDEIQLERSKNNCNAQMEAYNSKKAIIEKELVAVSSALEVLTEWGAREVFMKEKVLRSQPTVLIQLEATDRNARRSALQALQKVDHVRDPSVNFIEVAINGGQDGLEHVMDMITELEATIRNDKENDLAEKAYCENKFSLELEPSISAQQVKAADADKVITEKTAEISNLDKIIKDLQDEAATKAAELATAEKLRKEDNAEYVKALANNGKAQTFLQKAEDRLKKFYHQDDDGKSVLDSESNEVLRLLHELISDLDQESIKLTSEEQLSVSLLESLKSSTDARALTISGLVGQKQKLKSDAEQEMQNAAGDKSDAEGELAALQKEKKATHLRCDSFLQNYAAKLEARDAELEALDQAKAILSGAQYSLIQMGRSGHKRVRNLRGKSISP